jgi:hypothetical protein
MPWHHPPAAFPRANSSPLHRGLRSQVERQLPKLHVVGSIPIAMPRTPVGSLISDSNGFRFLGWLTEKELGTARVRAD